MPQKTDWTTFSIGISLGIVIGVGAALIGVAAGVPTAAVAPVTGAVVASLVPLIYRWRSKKREGR